MYTVLELEEEVILQDHLATYFIARPRRLAILLEILFPARTLPLDFQQSVQATQVPVDLLLNEFIPETYFVIFNELFPINLLLAILEGYFQSIQGNHFDHFRISFPLATLIQPPPLHPCRTVRHRL